MTHGMRRPPGTRGQSLVEYALILSMVAVVVVVALMTFGAKTRALTNRVQEKVGETGGK